MEEEIQQTKNQNSQVQQIKQEDDTNNNNIKSEESDNINKKDDEFYFEIDSLKDLFKTFMYEYQPPQNPTDPIPEPKIVKYKEDFARENENILINKSFLPKSKETKSRFFLEKYELLRWQFIHLDQLLEGMQQFRKIQERKDLVKEEPQKRVKKQEKQQKPIITIQGIDIKTIPTNYNSKEQFREELKVFLTKKKALAQSENLIKINNNCLVKQTENSENYINQLKNLKKYFQIIQPQQLTNEFLSKFNFPQERADKYTMFKHKDQYKFFINIASEKLIGDNTQLQIRPEMLFIPVEKNNKNELVVVTKYIDMIHPSLLQKCMVVKLMTMQLDTGMSLKSIYYQKPYDEENFQESENKILQILNAYRMRIMEHIMFKKLKNYAKQIPLKDKQQIILTDTVQKQLIQLKFDIYYELKIELKIPSQQEIDAVYNPSSVNYCPKIEIYQKLTSLFLEQKNFCLFYWYLIEIKIMLYQEITRKVRLSQRQPQSIDKIIESRFGNIQKIIVTEIVFKVQNQQQQQSQQQQQQLPFPKEIYIPKFQVQVLPFKTVINKFEYLPQLDIKFEDTLYDIKILQRALLQQPQLQQQQLYNNL